MKKIISFVYLFISILSFGQKPLNDPHWELIWEDDFEVFDSEKWLKVDWAEHSEPQLYLKENVSILDGNLVLEINNNPTYCPPNPPTIWGACWPCENKTYAYTSGWVESKQAYNVTFGYIESKIKLPYGYGLWPAFWTYIGSGVEGVNAAEIDIFEMLGGEIPNSNTISTNIHLNYPDRNEHRMDFKPPGFDYTDWHTYGIEWSPNEIVWYVDGAPIRSLKNHGIIDSSRIIFNLAVEPSHLPNSKTPFPSEMLVDYVQVYELKKDCNTKLEACHYDFTKHDNQVKKEIILGGKDCFNSIPENTTQFLRATDGVEIKGEFIIPLGSELYIDVNRCN